MTVNPTPTVTITQSDGTTLAFTVAAASRAVQGLPVLLLDDLTASWGRAGYTEHHDAQTAKFSVLWPSGFGRTAAAAARVNWDDWMGQPVVMSWSVTVAGVTTTRTFFRGRISDVTLRPRDPDRDVPTGRAPRPRGAYVDVVAMGVLADLANRLTGTEAWPDETGDARMNRLRALAGTLVAGISYRTFWAGAPMAARNVDGVGCLDLLRAMYDTAGGDRLGYDPHTNVVAFIRRRSIQSPITASPPGSNWRARLRNDPTLYSGGVHISAHSVNPYPMLDARWIEGGRQLVRSATSRITRVVTHWTEAGVAKSSTLVATGSEDVGGVRALDLQTELRDAGWAGTCQSDWFGMVVNEGRNPVPDPMTYRADLAGGFDTVAAAQLLIGGAELTDGTEFQGNSSLVFIAGDLHQALNLHSIYGVIGGEIRYKDGGWRATINTMRGWWEETGGMHLRIRHSDMYANPTRDRFLIKDLANSITWNDLRTVSTW